MSMSLKALDRMIAAEKAEHSTLAASAKATSSVVPPWQRASQPISAAAAAPSSSIASSLSSAASSTSSYANSFAARQRSQGAKPELLAGPKAGLNVGAQRAPSADNQLQLRRQIDAMRKKMVKDRAQANSTISALRADKEALEKDCQAKLEKITSASKRTESGLATKIAGLEQEVQKLRAQARTRAKRRKEQEKAWQLAIDTLRSENIRLSQADTECNRFREDAKRLTEANRELEQRVQDMERRHRKDIDEMLLRYSEAENDLRAKLEKASKAAAASSDMQPKSDQRTHMQESVAKHQTLQPAHSTALLSGNDASARHSSTMGPPLAREETARLTTADLSTPFSQSWKHRNPLQFSGSHISAASSFSSTTTAPKVFSTTRTAWQPKLTPSAPQSVAGAGISTTNAMEAFRKAAAPVLSTNNPTYSTKLGAVSAASTLRTQDATSEQRAPQAQSNVVPASTSRPSPASQLLPPDAAGSFEEKLALIRAQRQQLQAQVERGVLLQQPAR